MSTAALLFLLVGGLVTYLVHSTILLALAWALTRWRAPRSPRLAERIWKLALAAGLLTSTGQVALGIRPWLGAWSLVPPTGPTLESAEVAVHGVGAQESEASAPSTRPAGRDHLVTESGSDALHAEQAAPSVSEAAGVDFITSWTPDRNALDQTPVDEVLEERTCTRGGSSVQLDALADEHAPDAPAPAREEALLAAGVAPARGAQGVAQNAADPALPRADPAAEHDLRTVASSAPLSSAAFRGWLGRAWARWSVRLPLVLSLAWATVAVLGLVFLALSWAGLLWRLRGRRRVVKGELHRRLAAIAARSGNGRAVRLSLSPALDVPLTVGFFRPEICLPERVATELTPAQQDAMLAHELAHARRRDPAWFGALAVLERLLFFQPLNRLGRRRVQDLAEWICDDDAVRWTGERLALASCLSEVAHWLVGRRALALPLATMAGSRSRLGQRIERLLDDRRSPTPEGRHRWLAPTTLAALPLVAAVLPGLSSADPARDATPASESGDGAPEASASDATSDVIDAPSPAPAGATDAETELVRPTPDAPDLERTPAETTRGAEETENAVPAELPELEIDSAAAPAAPAARPIGLDLSYALFETELRGLDDEWQELKDELAEIELPEGLAAELERLEARVDELRARGRRVSELLPGLEPAPEIGPDE